VPSADDAGRRVWEAATLLALRDRLRAGDIWVEGSRQWRAIEDQLNSPSLFAAMREARPLPIAAPAAAEEYLAEHRDLLERRFSEVAVKAVADNLEDLRIKGEELKDYPAQGGDARSGRNPRRSAVSDVADPSHRQPARRGGSLDRSQQRLYPPAFRRAGRRPTHRAIARGDLPLRSCDLGETEMIVEDFSPIR
jgi:hypothetical protein